ncbi:SLAM family member 9-like isoform X2 [Tupaia chinensis]|uniref:SLAM family member 9-like isoform X2 n=1 Tax=Tupaia chinensis TaxID=246437 RepID=UPI0003C8D6C1|nr:SLAM family member 9-like isoform X2 [Tupaia chinensis]
MDSFGSLWFSTQVLLFHTGLLLGLLTVEDSISSCTVNKIVQESVQLEFNSSLDPLIREIEWNKLSGKKKQFLVTWKPSTPKPDWYNLEDKYKHRFNLTETAFLSIRNLTVEMSGLYAATIKFHSGDSQEQTFRLCVYEPITQPEIMIHSSSVTSGWCNVSLECETPGATDNSTVTWLSKGLSMELSQREALVPALDSGSLSLNLPMSQLNGYLTCLASNPVDQKNTTLDLETICLLRDSHQSKWPRVIILVLVLMTLGVGLWIWKTKKIKRGEATLQPAAVGSEAAPQALPTEDYTDLQTVQTGGVNSHDIAYAEISLLGHPQNTVEKGSSPAQSPKKTPGLHTVYEKIRRSPRPEGCLDHEDTGQ